MSRTASPSSCFTLAISAMTTMATSQEAARSSTSRIARPSFPLAAAQIWLRVTVRPSTASPTAWETKTGKVTLTRRETMATPPRASAPTAQSLPRVTSSPSMTSNRDVPMRARIVVGIAAMRLTMSEMARREPWLRRKARKAPSRISPTPSGRSGTIPGLVVYPGRSPTWAAVGGGGTATGGVGSAAVGVGTGTGAVGASVIGPWWLGPGPGYAGVGGGLPCPGAGYAGPGAG